MRIDAHQHFWRYDAKEYDWIDDSMSVLQRDFLPAESKREMTPIGFDACVAVQARQSLEETRFLLSLADQHPSIVGIVGWVDLQSDDARQQLEAVAVRRRLVGVRHIVQSEPDDRFLLRPAFCRGVELLEEFGLAYDILIYSRHLPVAAEFVSRFPNQRFVLDHAAKPPIRSGAIAEWARNLRRLASFSTVWCKVSGLVTEADWHDWTPDQIRPCLDVVFEAFGPNRLMIGSDWPVCTVAATYDRAMKLAVDYINRLKMTDAERDGVLGGNAQRFWRLDETRSAGSRADSSVRSRM